MSREAFTALKDDLVAIYKDRDEWRAGAETWQAAYEFTSQRCRVLEHELARVNAAGCQTLVVTVALIADTRAEAEGLAQALRDQEEVLDHFSERLTRLNGELGTLLAELGEDPETLTQDELVPALRELIDLMGSPRPAPAAPSPASRFARLFRCFSA